MWDKRGKQLFKSIFANKKHLLDAVDYKPTVTKLYVISQNHKMSDLQTLNSDNK